MQPNPEQFRDRIEAYDNVAPSYLAKYKLCPLMFFFSRIAKVRDRSKVSEVLVFGNMVHWALETYFAKKVAGEKAWLETCHRAFRTYDQALVGKTIEKAKDAFDWVAWKLYALITERKTVYMSEQAFKARSPGGHGISGRTDFTIFYPEERRFQVFDFKGSFKVPAPDQLVFYKWWIRDRWPNAEKIDVAYLWFTRKKLVQAEITGEMESALDDEVGAMLEGVKAGRFDPCKGKHCSWCGFKYCCPLWGGKSG